MIEYLQDILDRRILSADLKTTNSCRIRNVGSISHNVATAKIRMSLFSANFSLLLEHNLECSELILYCPTQVETKILLTSSHMCLQ